MKTVLRSAVPDDFEAVLAINRQSVPYVALLQEPEFALLTEICEHFKVVDVGGEVVAYIFAMSQNAPYAGEEFQWFRDNSSERFFYIDQIAIAPSWRGSGLGRRLYENLEKSAARKSAYMLACEVNYDPPNRESQAFHRRVGFRETARMETRGLTVSLLTKQWPSTAEEL